MVYPHKIRSKKCWNQYSVWFYHILAAECLMEVKTSDKYLLYRIAARVELTVLCVLDTNGAGAY